jgi:hypothetical protein
MCRHVERKVEEPVLDVTRRELAEVVEAAFAYPTCTVEEMIEAARVAGSRPEVEAALRRLPRREYTELRQLWEFLSDLSVDR